jgi:hypothetical protein
VVMMSRNVLVRRLPPTLVAQYQTRLTDKAL